MSMYRLTKYLLRLNKIAKPHERLQFLRQVFYA